MANHTLFHDVVLTDGGTVDVDLTAQVDDFHGDTLHAPHAHYAHGDDEPLVIPVLANAGTSAQPGGYTVQRLTGPERIRITSLAPLDVGKSQTVRLQVMRCHSIFGRDNQS